MKTLGETSTDPKRNLGESHDPISARNQKCYWRKPLAENVSVLDIGMSELVDSDDNNDSSVE